MTLTKCDIFGCKNIFLERAHLTKIKTGSNLSKEWRWSAYCFGLREIAPIVLTLRHSTALFHICMALFHICMAWFGAHSYLITAKPAPPMANASMLVLRYISSRSLTLERSVALQHTWMSDRVRLVFVHLRIEVTTLYVVCS